MKDPFGFIYITTNTVTGKKYIGQSRYSKPKWETYLGSGKFLLESIAKHGRENFRRVIICEADSREELCELERYFIKKFNAVDNRSFYNVADGGYATRGFSGKKHSAERNAILSQKMMGHSVSESTREKLRQREPTDRMRENMRKIASNNTGARHPRATAVTIDGKTFPTITAAIKDTGYAFHDIRHYLACGEHPNDRMIKKKVPTYHT